MNNFELSRYFELVSTQFKSNQNQIILYNSENEKQAVNYVIENITRNFVIIDYVDGIGLIHGIKSIKEYTSEGVVNSCKEMVSKYNHCIYYVTCDIDTRLTRREEETLIAQKIIKNLSGYKVFDICQCGNNAVPVFARAVSEVNNRSNNTVYLNLLYGIGDYFVLGSIYIEAIRRLVRSEKKVFLLFGDQYNPNVGKLYNIFLRDECEYLAFYNSCYLNKTLKDNRKIHSMDIIDHLNVFGEDERKRHILYMSQDILLDGEFVEPYKYAGYIKNAVLKNLPNEEKEYIDKLTAVPCIGFQFYTGRKNCNGEWIAHDSRCWDQNNVYDFIKKCQSLDKRIVILTPHPYDCIGNAIELNNISLAGYVYAVSKMQYIVGIDSSAGHIAALYDIPNITLWCSPLGLTNGYNIYVGFRPIRNNYSIVTTKGIMDQLDANKVFETIQNLLEKKSELSTELTAQNYDDWNQISVKYY